ncbi:hypothetical protein HBI56_045440 [Parastagonospora nodorum]|uniref:DUF2306 domain-containing protein n=2 Tax=Phaeosphaeria nodorum (strain SN15 / ATCC MYA-4574 / FGSC 10173) TaxID=321614 RepID=Q0V223_PHANO|nr:hypothetical protein SNOG_01941 [Parastagonospora nodorum SN15]KAH3916433.1 hypothetical protein HBH56_058560 [Parastagonospora nodorum]EAT90153.2 hypothetical protein SNOG_01941 [Parastagonospora nodorum SN15]KAH3930677.1 hypothetical protein HBH54_102490 [Parastagonospora nodorum]KAH3965384.1 hypothetical protein HBH51_151270 [Parastagonospora nodorum]KAH3977440.1 hypothetical protein HBH52_111590 [Parastagonospora nodorum]
MSIMVTPTRATSKSTKTWAEKIYNPVGFTKGYNFALYFIFGGAMVGFCLARFMYLNFDNNFCPSTPSGDGNGAAPGECYYFLNFDRYKIGILLHLASVLPAGILAVMQFTPYIRHRWIMVHRISGYFAILLYAISLVGALMIARHSFGGGLDVQAWIGFVGTGVLVCFIISYINIRRLQIEQHRAWMLRGWFYAGAIITNRLIMIIAAMIISKQEYFVAWPCTKIESTFSDASEFLSSYPSCAAYINGTDLTEFALVNASMDGPGGANAGAALNVPFGMALWLSVVIHAIGVEIYLHLTPKEAQRLRQVSYQRQLEAGLRNPGSAGLTSDRLGDAEKWTPEQQPRLASTGTAVSTVSTVNVSQETK